MKKRGDELSDTQQTAAVVDNSVRAKSKKSVYIYITTLFLAVMLFIFLSYLIEQRNNTEISALHEKNTTAEQNIENLQDSNQQLRNENDGYKKQIEELETQVTMLESEISEIKQETMQSQQSADNQQTENTAG